MDDNIRRKAYSLDREENLFDEIFEDFSGVEPVDVQKYGEEYEEEQVEEPSPVEMMKSRFTPEVTHEQDEELVDDGIIKRGYSSEDVDFSDNEGIEFGKGADSVQEKVRMLEKVNAKLKQKGLRRRYVLTDMDAPERAHVYEDNVGKYFYKINATARPSDVTKVLDGYDSWFEIPKSERVGATVVLLCKSFPWVVQEADSLEKVDKFLERAVINETDDLETEDVFTMDQVKEVKERLLNR